MRLCGEERLRQFFMLLIGAVVACAPPTSPPQAADPTPGDAATATLATSARPGGRLVVALTAEPKTLNPVTAGDFTSRAVIHRMTADLLRIDRESQETVPALAERWTVTPDGRRYTMNLRRGLRFSDGHPADADDVVFSFRVYLDERVAAPGRDLLKVDGKPLTVSKLDPHTVVVELPEPYAAAERLFDGFAILPRHLLEEAYAAGRLAEVWGLDTPAEEIVGLGPFRLKEHHPGERLVLERNPHYWKTDDAGQRLPYLDEIVFLFVPTQDAQVVRFQAGEIDLIDRLSAESFSLLERDAGERGNQLHDLGPGLDYNFMFFNLNDLSGKQLGAIEGKQRWFRDVRFRRAVLTAIDLEGIVRLVYRGRATPLATHVTPGDKHWAHPTLVPPTRSLERARQLLREIGFRWDDEGTLIDASGQQVELSLMTAASSSLRGRIAAILQDDLRQLGLQVQVVPLARGAFLERLLKTHDYEACILGLGGGATGPNPAMNVMLSNGSYHLWHLGQSEPATSWEAEIDQLMRQQLITLDPTERLRLYQRVQEIVADQLPLLSLVSPNVLVGAKAGLGNFRPAVLDHPTLWNVDELYWR